MMRSLESLGHLRLKALAVLLAVFVIGVLTGAAIERAGFLRAPQPPPGRGLPPHLWDKLELTAEQNRLIDAIMANYRPRTDALYDRIMPDVRALSDSMRAEIRAVLSPAQQEAFDQVEPPPADRRPPKRPPCSGEKRPQEPPADRCR